MSPEQDRIKNEAHALCKKIDTAALGICIRALKSSSTAKDFENATQAACEQLEPYAELHALLSGSAASTLDSFLSEVGSAAVTTQRKLDVQNRQALEEARALGLPPSSVFQLPKLSATVKFAISKAKKDRIGLVFASKSSGSELTNEQTLSFDIVSVPPSPELIRSAEVAAETTQPILDEDIRSKVALLLRNGSTPVKTRGDNDASGPQKEEIRTIAAQDFGRAILVRESPRTDSESQTYLMFYAAPEPPPGAPKVPPDYLVGTWEIDLGKSIVRVVWSYKSPGSQSEDYGPFQRWVRHLADMQLAVLKPNQG